MARGRALDTVLCKYHENIAGALLNGTYPSQRFLFFFVFFLVVKPLRDSSKTVGPSQHVKPERARWEAVCTLLSLRRASRFHALRSPAFSGLCKMHTLATFGQRYHPTGPQNAMAARNILVSTMRPWQHFHIQPFFGWCCGGLSMIFLGFIHITGYFFRAITKHKFT